MEEGSLLQEALANAQQQFDNKNNNNDNDRNVLWLDVFCLDSSTSSGSSSLSSSSSQKHLLTLAKIAKDINEFFHFSSSSYLWHLGGDGPVFGIAVTDSIPHLRAACRYGPCVADEWKAIDLLRQYCKEKSTSTSSSSVYNNYNIAASCWDVSDGQVILIQTADLLPEWLDEDETDTHRHAVWFQSNNNSGEGNVELKILKTPHVSLQEACRILTTTKPNSNNNDHDTIAVEDSQRIQFALESWLDLQFNNNKNDDHAAKTTTTTTTTTTHRMPILVPRQMAMLLRRRPDLTHAAIQAYCQHLETNNKERRRQRTNNNNNNNNENNNDKSSTKILTKYDDWVWTTQTVSRTNYAMLRTMVTVPIDEDENDNNNNNDDDDDAWMTIPDSIPPRGLAVEVKRQQRKYANSESSILTPHLRYGISCGIRIVLGFEYLMMSMSMMTNNNNNSNVKNSKTPPPSSPQERMLNWTRLLRGNGSADAAAWIEKAFLQGPNQSTIDLEPILKCPVFQDEWNLTITLYSHPTLSLRDQIRQGLKVSSSSADDDNEDYPIPTPNQVDNDQWLQLFQQQEQQDQEGQNPDATGGLDTMLSQFQNFMVRPSGAGGVEPTTTTAGTASKNPPQELQSKSLEIRPRIVLNILRAVLKDDDLIFPPKSVEDNRNNNNTGRSSRGAGAKNKSDPYFYQSDYDHVLLGGDDNDHGGGGDGGDEEDNEMKNLMDAMDQELLQGSSKLSRRLDGIDGMDEQQQETKNGGPTAAVGKDEDEDEGGHVLVNLLKSLEASGGMPGPVPNMMKEMGVNVPKP